MNAPLRVLMHVMTAATDTTIPDDFLNLYPDDVPDNLGDLATAGVSLGPILIGSIVVVAIGAAMFGRGRRRA